jgi:TonB family protein
VQEARPEPPASRPPPTEPQQAAAAPPPPPPPSQQSLESALPPLDAPPPPVTANEIPRPPAPPPPAPKAPPPTQARVQPSPPPVAPPQNPTLHTSPLTTAPQQRAPAEQQQAARQSPSFVNPAQSFGQKRVEDQYIWQVAQKLSAHQQFVRNASTESGNVVLRLVIARDGRLVDVGLSRSSGIATLDQASMAMVRAAGPYPPFPEELSGATHAFILPLYFKRN